MKNKNTITKLTLKYKYLTVELQEVKENLNVFKEQFTKYITNLEQTHKIQIFNRETTIPEKNSKKVKKNNKPVIDNVINDMYKQIANHTHPDKTGGDDVMTCMFREAGEAKEHNDIITLIDICNDVGVDTPELEDRHYTMIESNITRVETQITNIKNSDAYVWGVADEQQRQKLELLLLSKSRSLE